MAGRWCMGRNGFRGRGGVTTLVLALGIASHPMAAHAAVSPTPGCEGTTAKECLSRAIEAMGGREKLAAIRTVRLDVIGHIELMEQSYRQAPFITSYVRKKVTIDHAMQRLLAKEHALWPESDLKQADSDRALIVTPAGWVNRIDGKDYPCGGGDLDTAREALALGPERVVLTADDASDLHFASAETIRSTPHTVLAFRWRGIPVRISSISTTICRTPWKRRRSSATFGFTGAMWSSESISTTGGGWMALNIRAIK